MTIFRSTLKVLPALLKSTRITVETSQHRQAENTAFGKISTAGKKLGKLSQKHQEFLKNVRVNRDKSLTTDALSEIRELSRGRDI